MRLWRALLGVLVLMGLAVGCRGGEAGAAVDGPRAFEHVKAQVALGPRPPGTEASARTRRYIRERLEALGWSVTEQPFEARTPLGPIPMTNLVARLSGRIPEALALAAHYDTRLFNDFRFVGANDGASGVAVLLELARVLAARPLEREAVLAFLDGEEALVEWSAADSLYGSRHLVEQWKASGEAARVRSMFVLDMVGDKDLEITRDLNSHPELQALLLEEARRLGHGSAFAGPPMPVADDHMPFLQAGIPAMVVIGFHSTPESPLYPAYWHTSEDTLDKVSPRSMEVVGRVVEATLRRLDQALN